MSNLANLDALEDPPLGIRYPLLPPPTLGQSSFLQPKFLVPNVDPLAIDEFDNFATEPSEKTPSKVVSATPLKLQPQIQTKSQPKVKLQKLSNGEPNSNLTSLSPNFSSDSGISTELETKLTLAQKSIPEIQAKFLESQSTNQTAPITEQSIDTPSIQPTSEQPQTESINETAIPEIQRKFLESQQTNITTPAQAQNIETYAKLGAVPEVIPSSPEIPNIQATPEPVQTENISESAIAQPVKSIPEIQAKFLESQSTNQTAPITEQSIDTLDIEQPLQQNELSPDSLATKNDEIIPVDSTLRKMPEIQRKFLESQQKNMPSITDIPNRNVPTLPSVLQNISHIQTSLSNKGNRIISSKSITPHTEDSWNSIDDLIGLVQRSPEPEATGSWSSIGELLLSGGSSRKKHDKPSSSNGNDNITQKSELHFTPQGYQTSVPKIQRKAKSIESNAISSQEVPDVSVSSIHDQKQEQLHGSAKDLEMLAQEIYCLLKQRIQIERERQGGSYFGQLPW